jgi:ParB family chromosome partitioning protein
MAKIKDFHAALDGKLATIDELFMVQEERDDIKREKVYDLDISEIDDYPNHPFQVRDDEEMLSLAESIKEYGVLSPAIARKNGERCQLVSGHRRKRASELAGRDTVPVIIRQLTDDEACVLMCDSNLQRERVLPSEKARAYKMKLDALKRQGKRSDLTSTPVVAKLRIGDEVGQSNGDSREQVRRFIRLTELIEPLLQMVDDNKIAFRPAVELSYLNKTAQKAVFEAIESEVCTPSLAQAIKMKNFANEDKLNPEVILSIMQEQKPNQREQVKIPRESLSKYFKEDATPQAITERIIKALELLHKRERQQAQKNCR